MYKTNGYECTTNTSLCNMYTIYKMYESIKNKMFVVQKKVILILRLT